MGSGSEVLTDLYRGLHTEQIVSFYRVPDRGSNNVAFDIGPDRRGATVIVADDDGAGRILTECFHCRRKWNKIESHRGSHRARRDLRPRVLKLYQHLDGFADNGNRRFQAELGGPEDGGGVAVGDAGL